MSISGFYHHNHKIYPLNQSHFLIIEYIHHYYYRDFQYIHNIYYIYILGYVYHNIVFLPHLR